MELPNPPELQLLEPLPPPRRAQGSALSEQAVRLLVPLLALPLAEAFLGARSPNLEACSAPVRALVHSAREQVRLEQPTLDSGPLTPSGPPILLVAALPLLAPGRLLELPLGVFSAPPLNHKLNRHL